jgi:lysyl-tRNA synthetase class 2
MSLKGIQIRTKTVQMVRERLLAEGFIEIIPQLSSINVPNEPTIYPVKLSNDSYLNTSPEAYLKQVMIQDSGNIFAFANTFRDLEGSGPWHQPEFLMVEWYQKDTTWLEQMDLTQKVIEGDVLKPWLRLSWINIWQEYTQTDLEKAITDKAMMKFCYKIGYRTEGATWEQLFNQVADNLIVPHLPKVPFFLIDYPARISPLAKVQPKRKYLAERFELYLDGIEVANGNTESFHEAKIRQIFVANTNNRPVDEEFLNSIKSLSGQQWAGVGLGIDRLGAIQNRIEMIEIQKV